MIAATNADLPAINTADGGTGNFATQPCPCCREAIAFSRTRRPVDRLESWNLADKHIIIMLERASEASEWVGPGGVQVGVEGGVILLESKYDFAADKQQTNGSTN